MSIEARQSKAIGTKLARAVKPPLLVLSQWLLSAKHSNTDFE
jgi:hypothetical protein